METASRSNDMPELQRLMPKLRVGYALWQQKVAVNRLRAVFFKIVVNGEECTTPLIVAMIAFALRPAAINA
jgi:hypothetical protein